MIEIIQNNVWLLAICPGIASLLIVVFCRKNSLLSRLIMIAGAAIAWLLSVGVISALLLKGQYSLNPVWIYYGVVSFLGLLTAVYSNSIMIGMTDIPRFCALFSLLLSSVLGLIGVSDFLQLFFYWELMGITIFFLTGFRLSDQNSALRAKRALLTSKLADLSLFVGIALVYSKFHTGDFAKLSGLITSSRLNDEFLLMIALLLFTGAIAKSAQFPFHVWLSDASSAPLGAVGLINACAVTFSGGLLAYRVVSIFQTVPYVSQIIVLTGIISALMGAVMCLVGEDIKQILAYSTMSQMGLVFIAFGSENMMVGSFQLLVYSLTKLLLFIVAGTIMAIIVRSPNIRDAAESKGKGLFIYLSFLIASLSTTGIFPFPGFFVYNWLVSSLWPVSTFMGGDGAEATLATFTVSFVLLILFLTCLYIGRMFVTIFHGNMLSFREQMHDKISPKLPVSLKVIVIALVLVLFGVSLTGWPGLAGKVSFMSYFHLGHTEDCVLDPISVGLTNGISLLGILLAIVIYKFGGRIPICQNKNVQSVNDFIRDGFYIRRVYSFSSTRLLENIGSLFWWIDVYIIDGTANKIGQVLTGLSNTLQKKQLDEDVNSLVLWSILIGLLVFSLYYFVYPRLVEIWLAGGDWPWTFRF